MKLVKQWISPLIVVGPQNPANPFDRCGCSALIDHIRRCRGLFVLAKDAAAPDAKNSIKASLSLKIWPQFNFRTMSATLPLLPGKGFERRRRSLRGQRMRMFPARATRSDEVDPVCRQKPFGGRAVFRRHFRLHELNARQRRRATRCEVEKLVALIIAQLLDKFGKERPSLVWPMNSQRKRRISSRLPSICFCFAAVLLGDEPPMGMHVRAVAGKSLDLTKCPA